MPGLGSVEKQEQGAPLPAKFSLIFICLESSST